MKLFKPADSQIATVIDIGGSSVGGAVVRLRRDGKPTLLFARRERLNFEHERRERLPEKILAALGGILSELASYSAAEARAPKGAGKGRRVYVVFSSPWFAAKTKVLSVKKAKPFSVTEEFMNEILNNELKSFAHHPGSVLKGIWPTVAFKMLENRVVQVRLNGYETSRPVGKTASEADLTLFMSMVPDDFHVQVDRRVRENFRHKTVEYYTYSLLFFSVVRDKFFDENYFILLNVGGEVTDISVAKEGVIVETVTIPLGKNYIIYKIAHGLSVSPQLASSLIKLHSEGKSHGELNEKIQRVLYGAEKEWLELFSQALLSFSEEIFLPKMIFLTVNNDLATFFLRTIRNEQYSQFTITGEPFQVVLLNADKIGGFCEFASKVPHDSFLGVESVFFNRVAYK